jgi:hypothetical protein
LRFFKEVQVLGLFSLYILFKQLKHFAPKLIILPLTEKFFAPADSSEHDNERFS